MNNFKCETQGTSTYLVYTVSNDDIVDTMSLGMITNNKIPGLASTVFTQMDESKFIKYNVSAKVAVSQFFTGAVNKKRLLGVFKGIVNAMLSAEEYMLDTNSIILDLDYIYTDVSTCETVLICLPIIDTENNGVNIGQFFKNIMFSTQFDQTENCDHVAKLINYLNSSIVFSLDEFKNLLEELENTTEKPVVSTIKKEQSAGSLNTEKKTQEQPVIKTTIEEKKSVEKKPVIQNQEKVLKQEKEVKSVKENVEKDDTPKMSLLYLMQHYSKENAAIYKAQKDSEKSKTTPPKPTKNKTKEKEPTTVNANFAIPGQEVTVTSPKEQRAGNTGNKTQNQKQETKPVVTVVDKPPVVPQGVKKNYGETTILNANVAGETTVLVANQQQTVQEVKPYLVRIKNNETVLIDKPFFRIGKERSYVDYFIGDNTAISRGHAVITATENGTFYIEDTNSKNHTYVNNQMIQSGVKVEISSGTKIRLANEDFEFVLR